MRPPSEKTGADLALIQLLPNALTITAICAGLSAIRFGVQGNYVLAVQLILLACVLDGLDGRLARLLRSSSPMGAELDSLADFLNFGVAPPLILYFWALQDMRSAAWISVLVYAVCCVVRLARFNVNDKAEAEKAKNGDAVGESGSFFTGIPSPAGALLVLLPMTASFAFHNRPTGLDDCRAYGADRLSDDQPHSDMVIQDHQNLAAACEIPAGRRGNFRRRPRDLRMDHARRALCGLYRHGDLGPIAGEENE
jgi:CDP-diacylglycerol--serine O-phosphatidyltransferase